MSQKFTRRDFAKLVGSTYVGSNALSSPFAFGQNAANNPDHFFLHVLIRGAMDQTVSFDARPNTFRDKKLIVNNLVSTAEPNRWQDLTNSSRSTLVTNHYDKLKKYFDDRLFSLMNGVGSAVDKTDFSHEPNVQYILTGKLTGASEVFYTQMAQAARKYDGNTMFDVFNLGPNFNDRISVNVGSFFQSQPAEFSSLADLFAAKSDAIDQENMTNYLKSANARFLNRYAKTGYGQKLDIYQNAIGNWSDLENRMRAAKTELSKVTPIPWSITSDPRGMPPIEFAKEAMKVARQIFVNRISRTVVLNVHFDSAIDTHGSDKASQQEDIGNKMSGYLESILAFIANEPFNPDNPSKGSMRDHVTFLVSTEFGRTYIQSDNPNVRPDPKTTGTNHNSFAASALLGGRGIKGGLILGRTDLQSIDAAGTNFTDVEPWHKEIEDYKFLIRPMGMPFNFKSLESNPKIVQGEYLKNVDDFLNHCHLVNSLFKLFKVEEQSFFAPHNGRARKYLDILS